MPTRCVFVDAWLKPDFIKLFVMKLFLMKYHISSSGIVWGFFDGIFQSCVRFHQNDNHSVGKEGTRRARLVFGGERVRPSLC